MERRPSLAVAVALLVVASGCSATAILDEDAEQSPPDVDVESRYAALDSVQGTQHSTMTVDGETTNTTATVRLDLSTSLRQYWRVESPPERAGNRMVVNDSVAVFYNASENTVRRFPRAGQSRAIDRGEYVSSIVSAARNDEQVSSPSGVSPLPVVPATSGGTMVPEGEINGYEVEYLGTQSVSGRTAHGFRMTASTDAAMDLNQTLWLDSEYYYPLKVQQTVDYENRTVEYTTVLRNVTFDEPLPDDAFDLDVPANATESSRNVTVEVYDAVDELRENASMSVPNPEVPDGYELTQARSVTGNLTQVALEYASDEGTVVVTKAESHAASNRTQGEVVTIDGHEGRYVTTGPSTMAIWTCDGRTYAVVATDLSRDQVLDVAASVSCE
jgi:outer membrane lipoprotein-sorting protein